MDGHTAELATRCHVLLLERGETVATAESLTGGLLGAAFTTRAGASSVYRGGVVAYTSELKCVLLGVPDELLRAHGPVHPETALAMAAGAWHRLGATYGLATTGVAGPEPHGGRPVGTVMLACAGRNGVEELREVRLSGEREEIRRRAVDTALELFHTVLSGQNRRRAG